MTHWGSPQAASRRTARLALTPNAVLSLGLSPIRVDASTIHMLYGRPPVAPPSFSQMSIAAAAPAAFDALTGGFMNGGS